MNAPAWPLKRNEIRRNMRNHTFGMVRERGSRAHQGWDLHAVPATPCYAIADGIIDATYSPTYGNVMLLEFQHQGQKLYAAYCHLSACLVRKGRPVKRGDLIGLTGNTGNAHSMKGKDQHLHFEIRTNPQVSTGLGGRLDPHVLYGYTPLDCPYHEFASQKKEALHKVSVQECGK